MGIPKQPHMPDAGIFIPAEKKPGTGLRAEVASAANDRYLWLAPVNDGSARFRHLIGNVAEFVTDPAAPGRYCVIGGSSLSPKELDPERAYEVPRMRKGYSDVGFRLAFKAAGVPLHVQIVRILREYMVGSAG